MRYVLIGAVRFSAACLRHLIDTGRPPVGVVTRPTTTTHADHADLEAPSLLAGVPVLQTADINSPDSVEWITARAPDVIFCFGWSRLLAAEILSIAPLGVVGYHPALLPRNRGRHPIIWALALGLTETGSTFFFMDSGADSGDILSQRHLAIEPGADASTLYDQLTETALSQIDAFFPQLRDGSFERRPQDSGQATYWRKRSAADGRIDWRMPTAGIHSLVRALTRPYPGATVLQNETDRIVWRSLSLTGEAPADAEPGRVLDVDGNKIDVKTGDGAIRLIEHELAPLPRKGEYL